MPFYSFGRSYEPPIYALQRAFFILFCLFSHFSAHNYEIWLQPAELYIEGSTTFIPLKYFHFRFLLTSAKRLLINKIPKGGSMRTFQNSKEGPIFASNDAQIGQYNSLSMLNLIHTFNGTTPSMKKFNNSRTTKAVDLKF